MRACKVYLINPKVGPMLSETHSGQGKAINFVTVLRLAIVSKNIILRPLLFGLIKHKKTRPFWKKRSCKFPYRYQIYRFIQFFPHPFGDAMISKNVKSIHLFPHWTHVLNHSKDSKRVSIYSPWPITTIDGDSLTIFQYPSTSLSSQVWNKAVVLTYPAYPGLFTE